MPAPRLHHLLLLAALTVACSSSPADPGQPTVDPSGNLPTLAALGVPAKPPSLVGVVVERRPDGRVLLEHRPVRPQCGHQAVASIGPATRIVRRSGAAATAQDLRPGVRVTAWFGDVELRSCPVQVEALAIVVE